jgi:hypothetical protein
MIYSAAFDGMPEKVRDRVYQRLFEILTGKDTGKTFAGLPPETRGAILDILRATKSGLPAEWRL